jgi:hypothetical protein
MPNAGMTRGLQDRLSTLSPATRSLIRAGRPGGGGAKVLKALSARAIQIWDALMPVSGRQACRLLSPATRTIPIISKVRPTINKIEPVTIHHLDSGSSGTRLIACFMQRARTAA